MKTKDEKNKTFRQLFDIRPVIAGGDLDWEKIFNIRQVVDLSKIFENCERSFASRRLKLPVRDERADDLYRRFVPLRKPTSANSPELEMIPGIVEAGEPREIVFEYQPAVIKAVEILPSREQLLNQLEDMCKDGFPLRSEKSSFSWPPPSAAVSFLSGAELPFKRFGSSFLPAGIFARLRKRAGRRLYLALFLAFVFASVLAWPAINFIGRKADEGLFGRKPSDSRGAFLKSRDFLAMSDFYEPGAATLEEFGNNLAGSQRKIDQVRRVLSAMVEDSPRDAGTANLSDLTELFGKASESLASALQFYSGRNFFAGVAAGNGSEENLTSLLSKTNRDFENVLSALAVIKDQVGKMNWEGMPPETTDGIFKLGEKTAGLASVINNSFELNRFLLDFLGAERPKKILVLLQDPNVPRGTGGLLSVYLLATVQGGSAGDLFFDNVFNNDDKLREKIVPPRPLQYFDLAWGMAGANWFFDFPTSAEKIGWFLEKSSGTKVDYAVLLSPQIFEDLLKLTGSVNLAETRKIVTAENFRGLFSGQLKAGSPELKQRSKMLAEFFPKLLSGLGGLDAKSSFQVLDMINKNLAEKNILIAAVDPEKEADIAKFGWAGEIKETEGNYLAIADSIIDKGDIYSGHLTKKIKEQTEIQDDGRIVTSLTIDYHGPDSIEFRSAESAESGVSGGMPVLDDFVRIFVPAGTELLEAKISSQDVYFPPIDYYAAGFRTDAKVAESENNLITDPSGVEIFSEGKKTVFGFWLKISPRKNRTVTVKYRLPFRVSADNDHYSLFWQKQPADYSEFESVFVFPKDLKAVVRSAEDARISSNTVKLSGKLSADKYYEIRFER